MTEQEKRSTEAEALATVQPGALAVQHELSIEDVLARVAKVKAVMTKVMREGDHYGVIPGTPKPTLFKPGAEILLLTFRLDPQYASVEEHDGSHLTVKSVCTLWHIPTGNRLGSGEGSCSTKESKYAYRRGSRTCPRCSKIETIIKGKAEYGGGWVCFGKKGGCGAKFKDGDAAIEGQNVDRVPNLDLADQYNTVLKMANKRSLVAAVLNVTAASEIFTQDLEDAPRPEPVVVRPMEPEVIEGEIVRIDEKEKEEKNGFAVITPQQITRFWAIANEHKWTKAQITDLIGGKGFGSTKEILVSEYEALIAALKARQPEPRP